MSVVHSSFDSSATLKAAANELLTVFSLSNASSLAQAAYDNVNYYSATNFSNHGPNYIRGTLANGDDFRLWGSNLTSYPKIITELKYTFNHFGADTNRVQLIGSISETSSTSGQMGFVTDANVWGDWGQVKISCANSMVRDATANISGVSFYSNLWGYGSGAALHLTGNLSSSTSIVNGVYQSEVTGFYDSATLIINEFYTEKYKIELTGISMNSAKDFTSAADFLELALANDDTINGRSSNDWLCGFDGNDLIIGAAGDDNIDGDSGVDTAIYSGLLSQYKIDIQKNSVSDMQSNRDGIDSLVNVERLNFSDTNIALDISGTAGEAYRIYKAAFDRAPDAGGLGFWIDAMDDGASLTSVASGFISSPEFQKLYGANVSDRDFVTKLYNNVLDRNPDQGGYDFWLAALANGSSREDILVNFSDSKENIANVAELIANGIQYQEWLG